MVTKMGIAGVLATYTSLTLLFVYQRDYKAALFFALMVLTMGRLFYTKYREEFSEWLPKRKRTARVSRAKSG